MTIYIADCSNPLFDYVLEMTYKDLHEDAILNGEHEQSIPFPHNGFAGKTHTKATITKLKNVRRTKQHKEAISKALKGRVSPTKGTKQKKKKCPHCNKRISVNTYPRWHGDNCKWQK